MDTEHVNPIAYLVKCKRCKFIARIEVPARIRVVARPKTVLGERGWTVEQRECRERVIDWLAAGVAGLVVQGDYYASTCWACYAEGFAGRGLQVDRVVGTVTDHVCGAKCMASKGPTCDCSCGGANHGKSWA